MSYDIWGLLGTQRTGLFLSPSQKCHRGLLRGPMSQDWYSVDPCGWSVSIVIRMSPWMPLSSGSSLFTFVLDSLRVAGQVICQWCLNGYLCFLSLTL